MVGDGGGNWVSSKSSTCDVDSDCSHVIFVLAIIGESEMFA